MQVATTLCSKLGLGSLLLWVSIQAVGQHRPTYPTPPEPADAQATARPPQPALAPKRRLDPAQLQQEIQELSSLAQDLTQDIDAVNRGVLPKETVNKLKRVEKLARHVRKEIAP